MTPARTPFLKSVAVLAGGAAMAHGVTAAALPVLSRLYSPADFSSLAVFAGLVSVCAVAAALRFDLAVPLPEAETDALNLAAMGIAASCAIAALLGAVVAVAGDRIAAALGQPELAPFLWLLPLAVALYGTNSVLQYWFTRTGDFPLIAKSRLAQSSASAAVQIACGLVPIAPLGLLAGHVMNGGVASVWLGLRLWRASAPSRLAVRLSRMRELLTEYRRFPTYSTLEALANAASMHVPMILVARVAAGPEAGYLLLAMTVMQAPMSLVGSAVGQVYVSGAPAERRAGTLGAFTADTAGQLARLGLGPILAAGIAAPALFGLVFGHQWDRAGVLVAWLTPWFVLQFLAAPIGLAFHVTGHQRAALWLQTGGLVLRVAAVLVVARWANAWVAEAYAVSGALFYFVYFVLAVRVAGLAPRDAFRRVAAHLPIMAGWTALGVLAAAGAAALVR